MTEPTRFPLAWPAHKPRKKSYEQKNGTFRQGDQTLTLSQAMRRVDAELTRLNASYPLVSTNLELKVDGSPKATQWVSDPGVCVYFHLKGKPYALACDSYTTVIQNIAAVAKHLEASRAIERYGVATAAETLQAFTALPPPADAKPKRPWWEVLGVIRDGADEDSIKAMFRAKAKKAHPDMGGASEALSELTEALKEALAEIQ